MKITEKDHFFERFDATKNRSRNFQLAVVILVAVFLISFCFALAIKMLAN
jgi:hypothetical protein